MADAIREAGGGIFAITSEPQSLATEAEATWKFGFPSVGDPHHEILGSCRERGWLDLFVNNEAALLTTRSWAAHPKGYFQPGVLALTSQSRVLYRWRGRPTRKNMGGAAERPTPGHVWSQVQPRLEGPAEEPELDDSPELDIRGVPWLLFLAMLLAHGWFLRPKTFPSGRADEQPSANPLSMFPRIAVFLAAWVAAFVFLPTGWVALALIAWGALVGPGLAKIQRGFQNIPAGEPSDPRTPEPR